MKTLCAFIALLLAPFISSYSQVGIGTTTPNQSAQLEISSSNKGFLPPRVALIATNLADPIANPALGLLVYNTATFGGSPNNVVPGYYYWNGSSWFPIDNKGTSMGDMQFWNGVKWVNIPLGLNGQQLTICNGIPVWGNCPTTVALRPSNNLLEGVMVSNNPNSPAGFYDELFLTGWTVGGVASNARVLLKFDLSSIPSNAIIDSAKLYLYGDVTPNIGNKVDAHYGNNNAFVIQRITTPFTSTANYTWNNPPTTVTTNQVLVAQSTTSFQNEVINVLPLIKDMQVAGNNGFLFKLQNEVTYNSRQYASSYDTNPAKHPQLIITYR